LRGDDSRLKPDVRVLISHYAQLLRRHIVVDSEIADLCRKIYSKHAKAIDLILEHRPDNEAKLRDYLEGMIKRQPGLVFDENPSKAYIRFALREWDVPKLLAPPELRRPEWKSGRILLFEFQNRPDCLK